MMPTRHVTVTLTSQRAYVFMHAMDHDSQEGQQNRWKVQTHAILEYAVVESPLDIVPSMNCSYSISIKIQDNSEMELVSTEHSAYDYTMAPNIQLV
jgi:hypothetical protein